MMGRAMGASSRPRFLPAVTGIRGIKCVSTIGIFGNKTKGKYITGILFSLRPFIWPNKSFVFRYVYFANRHM